MTERRKQYTLTDDNLLVESVNSRTGNLSSCFMEFAKQTGHPLSSVRKHYYTKIKPSNAPSAAPAPAIHLASDGETTARTGEKWTDEEDKILRDHLEVNPGNFHACFHAVAEEIGRTPTAVASHWYAVLSKRTDLPPILITASKNKVQRNRKNGKGIESNPSIWRRLLAVLRTLHI